MAQTIQLVVNTGKPQTSQTYDVTQGGVQGQPVRIQAVKGARYQLQDPAAQNTAPQNLRSKRVGKNLHISLDGSTESDLIIEGYYDAPPEAGGQGSVYGRAEDGKLYEYVPQDASAAPSPMALRDGGPAVNQRLGGLEIEDYELSTLPVAAGGGGLGGLAAGLAGAAAAGAKKGATDDKAATGLAKIEAFNNGNGTTPAAPTLQDYLDAGVTGVTADNLAAVNAKVLAASSGGADTVSEVQALVTAANNALAKIEAYNNGNGITPAALTLQDYAAAGVTGVTANNLAAVNATVLAASTGGADTAPEVQALVTAANNALAKIEAYNNGNGTTPAALTVADYQAAGIAGVNAGNLAAINAKVLSQNPGAANTAPDVQALINGINDALVKIEAYNNGNGVTPPALTLQDYADAGITGVTADNLAAVNAQVLAQSRGGADTLPEVDALVTAANAALAKIDAYNNGNGTTPPALTVADYQAAGITGVNAGNLAAVNAKVLGAGAGDTDTTTEVQNLVTHVNDALVKIEAYNNGDGVTPPALTLQDYADAGITGVTADNLAAVNTQVLAQSRGGADTVSEVQALVSAAGSAIAKIEAYNNGNGTTPPALTVGDYQAAGITGVNAGNLAAVNAKVLGSGAGDTDTTTEVQNLVTRVNDALVKIEAYNNGDGVTPPALTTQDYADAGITGVTADNLAAVNTQVLAQSRGGADTATEVQALVSAADAALAKIEAYNNGNGTTPPALTPQDYANAGITGVNANNLAAVNAKILAQNTGGANTTPEVQAVVSAINDALVKIEAYNNGDGVTPPALTAQDYADAGITGVTADNVVAVNAQVLAQSAGGADTVSEVQTLVSAADAALAKIEAYNNGDGTTPPALTVADYQAAAITGVNSSNVAAVNAQVLAQAAGGANSVGEVQAIANGINNALVKIEAFNNGDGTTPYPLSLQDYVNAGVTGVTADNLAAVNAQVLAQSTGGADTPAEVQALVTAANNALAKIEAYNNGNGTTPAALSVQDYADAGIVGVYAGNLNAVNATVLAANTGDADTVSDIQTLVAAAGNALAKIEAYNNGDGHVPSPLTLQDFAAAGVTGVSVDNFAAVNAQVLAANTGGADTGPEVQALVVAANNALAKIEAYNNGNGTTPAALTVADYIAAGISGVNTDNVAAVNAKLLAASTGGADTCPEIQAFANAVNNALVKIEAYNNGNGITPVALTVQDYEDAGITGVTPENLTAVNAQVLAQTAGGADSVSDVQTLVDAAAAALAKIEAYNNGDGTTPPALTVADYQAAGVTGVSTDNLAAVNGKVLAQSAGGADTVAEVQALANAVNNALAKIEAYNNGDGVTPPALTLQDYANAGITGVNANNLAAVNAQVLAQSTGGADTVAEVQALVTAASNALVKIEAYNNGDGTTPAALTVADYRAAGVTGVNTDNLAAVNAKVLAQSTGGADTVAEVQTLVNAVNTAIAKVEAYNNGDGVTPVALTLADYQAAGITGVTADNVVAVNAQVLAQSAGGADTVGEVQTLVTAAINALAKIEAYNNGNGTTPAALTVADYQAAGITGVNTDNLAAVNSKVLAQSTGGADTVAEVQALANGVNNALAKIEAYNNGDGTNPSALTVQDYANAGITGVDANNVTAVNAQVLAQSTGGADTVAEVQALVTAASNALVKIEAYNNGDGTTPAALTVADYQAAGVTGVNTDNLASVNAKVLAQSTGGADTVAEVQALVNGVNNALAKIEAYNNGDGITPVALTVADYQAAGITSVTADNVAAINAKVLAQSTGGADTAGEVQTLVNNLIAAVAHIEAYNNGNGTTPAALTLQDYDNAGVTGVTADNLAAVNAQVLAQSAGGADTPTEIQTLVSAANDALAKIEAYNNGNGTTPAALTAQDYANAGVTGVTADNLAAVNAQVLTQSTGDADTCADVQTLVTAANNALAKIEAYNNGDGTTPTALTVADYQAAGITGVTADNLTVVNAQVLAQSTGGADTCPEVQALVSTAVGAFSTSLNVIATYAETGVTAPAASDYSHVGVSGVTAGNLAAINSAINAQAGADSTVGNANDRDGADTAAEVQTIVNAYNAILSAADGVDNVANNANPTQAQYASIGVTGVSSAAHASLLGDIIDAQATTAVNTVAKVQALADAVAAVFTGAANGTAPTLAQLLSLGLTDVNANNIALVQAAIAGTANDGSGVDTWAELQTLVSAVNDPAIIGGDTAKALTEANAALSTSGTLTITDADSAATFAAQTNTAGSNGYGTFSINTAGAWTYTMNSAHDAFVGGQSYTDSFTATSADGTTQVVTVTITGTNDAVVISGTSTAALTETNAAQSTSGTLVATDIDGTDNTFTAQTNVAGSNGYGVFSINTAGAWTYTMNSAHDAFVGGTAYTDSITVAVADGTTQVVTVTITGTNDAAVISGVSTAALTESNAAQTATGTLTSTDVDGTANLFTAQSNVAGSNGYGTFSITSGGVWTYTMGSAHDAFVGGSTHTDSITVATADGTTQVVTVTITGTNDAAVISGTSTAALTETNAAQTATGTLTSTDVDGTANLFTAQSNVAGSNGYGTFSINTAGAWTYTMSSAQDAFVGGQNYTDSITVTTADGTQQVVTVTITGTNDVVVISGVSTAALTESNVAQTASGTLVATDVDGTDNTFTAQTNVAGSNGYGTFSINTGGVWTYTMGSAQDAFVAGSTHTDSITVATADGTSQVVTVTITGTNDAPSNTVPGAQTATEDTQVVITGISTTDVDGSVVSTQLTVLHGSLNVSIAGGATISAGANNSATLTLSGTPTQINAALATLKYTGALNYNGADTLTVLSTDDAGTPLTDTDTVGITVTAVNEAPVNTVPGAQNATEATQLAITGLSVEDVDGNLATTQLTVLHGSLNVSITGGATISAGANNSATLTLSGTQAQINAALATLKYTSVANYSGADTLTMLSTDSDGTPLTDSDTVGITVAGVNHAPINTVPGAQTAVEDTQLSITGISVNDVDGNLATTKLTVLHGALNVDITGGATISAGANDSATLTLSGTQTQINAALATLKYTGASNYNGADTLTVLSTDSDGTPLTDSDNVAITVSAVNDVPVLANTSTLAYTENDAATAINTAITVSDVDSTTLASAVVKITGGFVAGQDVLSFTNVSATMGNIAGVLSGDTMTLTSAGSTATLAQWQVALRAVSYRNSSDNPTTAARTVSYTINDGAATATAVTSTINVTAVNDAPTTVTVIYTCMEETPAPVNGTTTGTAIADLPELAGKDLEGVVVGLAITSLPTNGYGTFWYSLNGGTTWINLNSITGLGTTNALVLDKTARVYWQPNADMSAANLTGVNQYTWDGTDGATSGSMVDLTGKMGGTGAYAATSSRFTLSVTGINDAPSLTVTSVGGSYAGTAVTAFSSASVWAGGSLGESSQKFIKLVLTVSGLADGAGEQLTLDGSTFSLTDGTTGTTVTNSVTYTVSVTGTTATVTLDSAAGVAASAFNTLVNSIAYSDVASVRTSGSRVIKLTSLQDNGGFANGGVDTGSLNLTSTVTMANTAPVNTVPAAQTAVEDTQLAISGLSVSDANGNLATTQLTVTHGTLNVSIAGGATISAGANDSATLTLSGTQAQINTALGTLKYTGALNYNGSDTLTVLSSDSASTPLTDSDTVAITVTAVNDVPVLANTSTLAYTENDVATAINTTITVTDVDSTTMASAVVKITSGYVAGQDVLSFTANSGTMGNITGTVSGDTVTLTSSGSTATLAQWETALRAVLYRNSSENPTTAARTVSYTINDGTGNATALTSTINVTAVNDQPAAASYANIYPNLEDSGAPVNGTTLGVTIGSISASYFSGKDPEGASLGLALVSSLSASSGTVWYSLDNGATWLNLTNASATASMTNAFLLSSTARVYVQGNANIQYGIADNKGRLWDGTDGATSGSYKDISSLTGATGAYSATDTTLYFGVTPVNDAPTLTATAVGGNYTGTAVSAFSTSNVSAGPSESSQTLIKLGFTVSGLADGADEKITVDGTTFSLTSANTGTTATNGFTYNVSLSGSTATVTLTNAAGVAKAAFDTLVNSIAYKDTSATPTTGNRVITITTVQDNGGIANGGVNANSTLALASTVTVTQPAGVDLGSSGTLLSPVQVEGHWYYYWDMDGAAGTVEYTTQQSLASIFKYDINGNLNPGSSMSEAYRYAILNGVTVALPTVNGGDAFSTGAQAGTSATGQTSTLNANTKYSDMLAIWDAFNGAGTTTGTSGIPTGWLGSNYWVAQTSGTYAYVVSLNNGDVTLAGASFPSSTTYRVSLEVIKANHAPVLDATASPAFADTYAAMSGPATGDTTAGDLLSSLIGNSSITDTDAGALTGIAITGVNSSGTLYYSLNGGTTWTAATSVSDTNALHLAMDTDTRVFFQANAALSLTDALTFRAWDRTIYNEGFYGDVSFADAANLNGKTNVSAYSSNTDTVAVNVTLKPVVGTTLDLGTVNGVRWNLINKFVANGMTYFFVDLDGSGAASVNDYNGNTHDDLDAIFNGGTDTTGLTNPTAGQDTERSAIIKGYTLVLPTLVELQAIRTAAGNAAPTGWGTLTTYWAADSTSAGTHKTLNFTNGTATTAFTDTNPSYFVVQVLPTPVAPVVLDLNRDGTFSYSHVLMDINGDGLLEQTAWAGAQDGVLVWDKYADGQVHDASQYAFAQYGGNTDLQGLAAGFDTNADGKFNAQDAKFAQFKVWQDLNQNGISDAGEVRSLADWGIAEISLSSDGVVRTPAAGVTEAGRTTATTSDGASMLVADAAFDNTSLDYSITPPNTTQVGAKLSVLGSGMNLDLSRFVAQHGAMAEVDLSGTGANSLKLNLSDVLGTPAQTLKVTGDADDVLNAQLATDWTNTGSVVTENGHTYAVYNANANAAAQLLIDQQLLN